MARLTLLTAALVCCPLLAAAGAEEAVPMTLREAIGAAMRNNPSILAKQEEPRAAVEDVKAALAVYEPTFTADLSINDIERPTSNALSGSVVLDEEHRGAEAALRKRMQSGAELAIVSTSLRTFTNSSFQGLVPQYTPSLGLEFEQPLLRNFLGAQADTDVATARNDADGATATFEAELTDFVAEVIAAYWGYTLAEAEVGVRSRSLELARELSRKADAMVKVGRQAPVAAKEAQAEAALREEEFIVAENNLRLAAKRLQFLVQPSTAQPSAMIQVQPTDRHVASRLEIDRPGSLDRAVENRPELRRARLDLANSVLRKDNARNQTRPSFDLYAHYFLLGLGGDDRPGTPVPSDFAGSYSDALDMVLDGDFHNYTVGVRVEVPLANDAAQARLGRSQAEYRREVHELQEAVRDVALEVEQAVGNLESAHKRVVAAKLAHELAEENLDQQRRRFELGVVTTTDVLDFQDRLTRAAAAEVRAVTDHANALAQLYRAEGTLLHHYDIEAPRFERRGDPWWSRF